MSGCAVCGDTFPDHRTLRIGCLYDLTEVSEKFEQAADRGMFQMTICKDCRGDFMAMLRQWIEHGPARAVERSVEELDPERNIPVRLEGRNVMMTLAEYNEWRWKEGR